ncbi:MAG: NAD-dependent succinate-semialdehyde dehydrogenase [Pseudoclavibacter sp.]|nr:NAD-dependent succinate-semialdehyde dehydrogenase [Pseudoclavibacter sp.]
MTYSTEAELIAKVPVQLFIGGQWVDGDAEPFAVHDPSTGEELAKVANATPEQGIRALDAAVEAQAGFGRLAPRERGEILRGAFELLMERRDEMAAIMTLEMGKPLAEAKGEVGYGGEFLRWFSEEAVRVHGRYGVQPEGTGRMVVTKHPVGPAFLITPWNFPLAMATRKIAPAIAAGCTSIVKPASLTPLTTLYFVKLLEEAGLPAGAVNVITTRNTGGVSSPIIADPRLRKLSFTGSTSVGQQLMRDAAGTMLRTSMELGGNAPFIVFEDADLDKAVEGVLAAKYRNIGQACTAANRVLVHESVADEFARRVAERVSAFPVGRGIEDGVVIGPLVEDKAVDKVAELVDDAVERGAQLLTGGKRIDGPGSFYEATVLNGISREAKIFREEIFGPVLPIITFSDEAEAVRLANDTEYGLISYVFTEDFKRGQRMIDQLETGMMGLNMGVISNAAGPFGGVKMSGIGREGGVEGIEEYLYTKYTLTPDPFA